MHKGIQSNGTAGQASAERFGDGGAWIDEALAAASATRWAPDAIPMDLDIAQWRAADVLTEDERRAVRHCLGFLASIPSRSKGVLRAVYQRMEVRACRQVLLHHMFEENLHASACGGIASALALNQDDMLACYLEAGGDAAASLMDAEEGREGDRQLVRSLIVHTCLVGGLLHAGSLIPVIALGHGGKLPGIAEQCRHILRDQSRHCDVGIGMTHALRRANPEVWDAAFDAAIEDLFRRAVAMSCSHARACVPRAASWLDQDRFEQYLRFEANHRADQLGLPMLFDDACPPCGWIL